MKIKWNWGTGIALTYTAFVVIIMGFVVHSSSKQIDLVSPDYYAKEIAFQGQMEKEARTKSLQYPLTWEVSDEAIVLNFPENISSTITGEIKFFCPANAENDRMELIETDIELQQVLLTKNFNPGRYKMQISWETGGLKYYNEGIILIPAN